MSGRYSVTVRMTVLAGNKTDAIAWAKTVTPDLPWSAFTVRSLKAPETVRPRKRKSPGQAVRS